MAANTSSKRVQISKSTASIVAFIAIASFITVFCLIASRALLSQRAYQSRVIEGKSQAKKQLESNIENVDKLRVQYKTFTETSENMLGGNPAGKGDKDGDNARIVLDALPSKYDFPALTTSLEKLLAGYRVDAITGTDEEKAQSTQSDTAAPKPIEMPFQVSVNSNYQSAVGLLATLEKSIRPIRVQSLVITSGQSEINLAITAVTYYQPTKGLNIATKEVK